MMISTHSTAQFAQESLRSSQQAIENVMRMETAAAAVALDQALESDEDSEVSAESDEASED